MDFPGPSTANGIEIADLTGCIDLHMHSTFSDGSQEPEYLVAWAASLGLKAIALTDHDNCNGIERALAAGKKHGVEVIPGLEISVDFSGGTFHLLGYFVDYHDKEFLATLAELVKSRDERNVKIVASLVEHGCDITLDELREEAGEAAVGRPHIAKILVRKGRFETTQQAFDELLASGKPCYFERLRFSAEDSIKLVLKAGGVPVIAHPYWLKLASIEALDKYIGELAGYGLRGMECIYSEHSAVFTEAAKQIAAKYGLIVTGGSDYHGGLVKPDVTLGHGKGGGFKIPGELLAGLKMEERRLKSEG